MANRSVTEEVEEEVAANNADIHVVNQHGDEIDPILMMFNEISEVVDGIDKAVKSSVVRSDLLKKLINIKTTVYTG